MNIVFSTQYTGGLPNQNIGPFSHVSVAGNLIVIMAFNQWGPTSWVGPTFVSSAVDGVFTQVPYWRLQGGSQWDWASFPGSGCAVDILYKVTAGGSDGFSFHATNGVLLVYYEVSGVTVNVDDFQIAGSAINAPIVGAPLAGHGLDDLCIQLLSSVNNSPTAITAPWTIDPFTPGMQDGPAYILDASGTQVAPTWTESPVNTDKYTSVSVAFGLGAAPPPPPTPAPPPPLSWFQLEKTVVCAKKDPTIPVRGSSS